MDGWCDRAAYAGWSGGKIIERPSAENSSSGETFPCGNRWKMIGQPRICVSTQDTVSEWQRSLAAGSRNYQLGTGLLEAQCDVMIMISCLAIDAKEHSTTGW